MLQWLKVSPAFQRLLPGGRLRGPTPYVLAIMTFAMMVVAAAGLALANAAGLVAGASQNRHVVQLSDSGGGRLEAALAAARSAPGVGAVRPVPEAEMRATLARWLGPAASDSSLPVPALIHLQLAPDASPAAIGARIEQAVPGARMVAEKATLAPLLHSMRVLQWLSLSLVVLMAAATSAAVVLAARGALDTHRSTIEVMHGIGATDRQVAGLFQRKIALDALAGSLAGGIAAALVLALIGGSAAFAGEIAARPPLGPRDYALLALRPLAAVLLATAVARGAVLRALRQAP
jgi:cell division transport system permease protein